MSLLILNELQQEVRRLLIAGSAVAAGDLRLQKLLPALERLGQSAPVLSRLAEAVHGVLKAEAGDNAGKLLELHTVLAAVLYTQGRTESKEPLVPLEGTDAVLPTAIPYRKLKPVIEALTQKGQGRTEQLRLAYEEGLFRDFRVVPAAVSALDDSYAEIAEFLHRTVIPQYGAEAIPSLRGQLKLDGGKGDARRLALLHSLLPSPDTALLLSAATDGSTDVRAAAIELLGDDPQQEAFILAQADDKKKDIRKAAYLALSRLATGAAVDRLFQALNSKDRDIAVEPVRLCRAGSLTLAVIRSAERTMEKIVQGEDVETSVAQLQADLASLEGKQEPEVGQLVIKLLSSPGFIIPVTESVQEAAADLLLELDMPEARRFAVSLHERYGRKFIACSFKAAIKLLPPEDVYDRYCGDLKDKKKPYAKDLLRALHETTHALERGYVSERPHPGPGQREWDPRWLQLLVSIDEEELACRFVDGPDRRAAAYFKSKCEASTGMHRGNTSQMLLALMYMREPEAPELVMRLLEKGGTKSFYYIDRIQQTLLTSLPSRYAGRLQAFAEQVAYAGLKTELTNIAETIAAKPERPEVGLPDQEEKGQGLWGWIKSKMS